MQFNLNPEQKEAVETTEGALLVLSGAGTGKTKVLTNRLAYIIENGLAKPWECLAVTFTNKAAKEMEERLASLVGGVASDVWLGTFHHIALRILRQYADRLGYQSGFTILGEDDQIRLVKQIMESESFDVKKTPPDAVLNVIQKWKDKGFMPSKILPGDSLDFTGGQIFTVYNLYQTRLKTMNAMDFGDLLLLCVELFKEHKDILAKYQTRFRYIMIDEYQDTNVIQYLWLRLLAQKYGNICCVGDDDQSIYSWRGAEIANILKFDTDFPNAKIIRLERNYRSTPHILGAASELIRNNKGRLGKELRAVDDVNGDGEKVLIAQVPSGREEAVLATEKIEDEHRKGIPYAKIAVLLRTGFQTREFEEAFIAGAIPYKVVGGAKFYDREEIKDAVAYLRLLYLPSDDMAFLRIVNKPRRGIGNTSIAVIQAEALKKGLSLFDTVKALLAENSSLLKPAARKNLNLFIEAFLRWKEIMRTLEDLSPSEVLEKVLADAGYFSMWKESNAPEAEVKLENLRELLTVLNSFDSIAAFLEHVSLISDTDDINQDDAVSLMTLHAAKGLEFDVVIMGGWEEGIFPHQRSLDEGGEKSLEEERRLAYVGITRARKKVYIFFASRRLVYNQWQNNMPSRFLAELPKEHIEERSFCSGFNGGFNQGGDFSYNPYNQSQNLFQKKQSFNKSSVRFKQGIRVYHKNFGYGVILKVEDDRLQIAFEDIGIKNIMADYVEVV